MTGHMGEDAERRSKNSSRPIVSKEEVVLSKTNDELLESIREITKVFKQRYEEKPTVDINNAITNLESIKL